MFKNILLSLIIRDLDKSEKQILIAVLLFSSLYEFVPNERFRPIKLYNIFLIINEVDCKAKNPFKSRKRIEKM